MAEWVELWDKHNKFRGRVHVATQTLELIERGVYTYFSLVTGREVKPPKENEQRKAA